jgi:hypothetical protein
MYKYTDKILLYMRKRFLRLFGQFKTGTASFDELNVLSSAKSLYAELQSIAEECLLMIAQHAYRENGGKNVGKIDRAWLKRQLESYDPVTRYVYLHEVERKCARFAESVIAGTNKASEIDTGLRYWSNMVSQYAVTITDAAVLLAYEDEGVEMVRWVTEVDDRRCSECRERHNQIYDIARVPPKPHLGCRCYLIPHWE